MIPIQKYQWLHLRDKRFVLVAILEYIQRHPLKFMLLTSFHSAMILKRILFPEILEQKCKTVKFSIPFLKEGFKFSAIGIFAVYEVSFERVIKTLKIVKNLKFNHISFRFSSFHYHIGVFYNLQVWKRLYSYFFVYICSFFHFVFLFQIPHCIFIFVW